jgi:predicted nuclease with TOPRIM domain
MQEVKESHKELWRLLKRYYQLGWPAEFVEKEIAKHEYRAIELAAAGQASKEAENTQLRAQFVELTRGLHQVIAERHQLQTEVECLNKGIDELHARYGQAHVRAEQAEARLEWVFANGHVRAQDFTTGNRDIYEIHTQQELEKAMKESK